MTEPPDNLKRLADLEKVLEISRSMVAAADLDQLLGLIVERSTELLDAERGTLFLYEPATNELVSRVATGTGEIRIPATAGICGATVATGQTINVPDAYADSRFNQGVDRNTGFRTRNILSVPLHDYQEQLVGVLQVLNKRRGPFDAHDVALAQTLAAQAGVALQRARLIEHYTQKQQMERAMQIARDIQRGLLPKEAPAIAGFDLAGFSEPADATGGDMYDFLRVREGQLMLFVADASGHGIGPAIVAAETRAMLRAMSLTETQMPAVLKTVNDLLAEDLDSSRFVTCFFAILDEALSELVYSSAGHGPLIFYSRATDTFKQVPATSVPLGIMAGIEYDDPVRHPLAAGDFAVILTDGFFEACAPNGDDYGLPRTIDLLRAARDKSAAEMISTLYASVKHFTANQPAADDLTAVVIRRN